MNHIYRIVWNKARGIWVAVSEHARGQGKSKESGHPRLALKGLLLLVPLSLISPLSFAAPTGGQVTAGSGTISQSGATTTINQGSQNLSLSWKSFNVGQAETVNFKQPNAGALAVNRIYDTRGSTILGHINANGQVWLINPNGILFGQSAQVNVGGLVASTLDTADGSTFAGSGTGSVVNEGTINAAHYVALLGHSVTNSGVITARLGTVAMGAGDQVSLTFSGNSLVKLQVNRSVVNALVANHGLIKADGGLVVMNAGARDTLLASVVNNDGVVEARTVSNHAGTITLLGGMAAGTVNVGGTLDASAPASLNPGGGNGGSIETSAAHVHIAGDAKITTKAASGQSGTWLIDPVDFTIAASGGDMTGSALSTSLGSGNVAILSSSGGTSGTGSINVDDAVSWSANTLTLTAADNIDINAVMTGTGTASLALNPATANGADTAVSGGTVKVGMNAGGFTGRVDFNSTGTLSIGGIAYTVITGLGAQGSTTGTDLQGIAGGLSGHYVLGANIDASSTSGWNANTGFVSIGSSTTQFTGVFDGLGHTIGNLYIKRPTTNKVGLFGIVSNGAIRNIGLAGGSVSGQVAVGELAGYSVNGTIISNAYATGSVTGSVTGSSSVGGLVGSSAGSTISNSYATGSVSSTGNTVGGLVGWNAFGGSISDSYATGSVTGSSSVGGLVGNNHNGSSISDSYATGSVSGTNTVGGLVGYNDSSSISDSYATGSVTGSSSVGGLVGDNDNSSSISDSYATGSVSGSSYVGGLVGENFAGTISNGYWDTTTGLTTGIGVNTGTVTGGGGLTDTQMQQSSSFTGFDFTNTWVQYDGHTDPLLRSFMTALTVTANGASKTYDGTAYAGGNGVSYSVTPNSHLLGTLAYGGSSQGAVSAGTYTIAPSGLYSDQQGYIIGYANGTLTVNKASLTVTAPQSVVNVRTTAQSLVNQPVPQQQGQLVIRNGSSGADGGGDQTGSGEESLHSPNQGKQILVGVSNTLLLEIEDGGVRLPLGVLGL